MGNKKTMYIIRIIAGGYIAYIGITLFIGMLNGENTMNPIVSTLFSIVFLGCGGYFAISSILGLAKDYKEQPVEPSADDDMEDLREAESELESMADETVEEAVIEDANETLQERLDRIKDKELEEVVQEKQE